MRIGTLGDLASGTVYLRLKNGTLEQWNTSKIPSEKILPLIDAGRVYVPWDHRYLEFDELGPEWPKARGAKTECETTEARGHGD